MAADLKAVEDFAAGTSTDIQFAAARPGPDIWRVRAFRLNNAHARLLAIILAHHKPFDLLTGQRVDTARALAWVNAKEYHHFFPQKFLKASGVKPHRINCLANFVMLSSASNKIISGRAPSDYLQDVEKAAGANLHEWLASNLITPEAFEAAKADDFDRFLRVRSDTIHAVLVQKATGQPHRDKRGVGVCSSSRAEVKQGWVAWVRHSDPMSSDTAKPENSAGSSRTGSEYRNT